MTFGEKIKARRLELNMTTEEVGNIVGIQRSAVTKYEKDKIDPTTERVLGFAKALQVPAAYLLPEYDYDEEQRLISAYWGAEPVYREAAMDILLNHQKKANASSEAG